MSQHESKSEWKLVAVVSLVVAAPCLLPALDHLTRGEWGLALLYAIPALCCCLLYLGALRIFGVGSAIEMGLSVFLISAVCAVGIPIVMRLFGWHLASK